MNIVFLKPTNLLLLGLIPLIIFTHFLMLKRKRAFALKFANFDAIAKIKGVDLLSKNIIILIINVIIVILLSFSLSDTVINRVIYSSSSSFILAIDTSRSMEANDMIPNRLEVAKDSAAFFINNLPIGTRIGIISFSGNSLIEQELTDDKSLLINSLKEISLSSIGGSDLGDAVYISANLLKGEEIKSVVLISDGGINVGTVDDLINYANENAVIVHTIGIGTENGGETSYGLSTINKNALQAIAYNTNGKFFEVATKDSLTQALNNILELKIKKVPLKISYYLTFLALLIMILEFILVNTRYRVLP